MLPSRRKPFKHDYLAILAKYPADAPLTRIAEQEGIKLGTLQNFIWRFKQPRERKPYRRGAKEVRREALLALLDRVNELKQQDLTGQEACGAITDIILDALDALGG